MDLHRGIMRQPKSSLKTKALLAERAHAMRQCHTASEAALFRLLSAKLGVAFKRQVPIGGRYIADFVAPQVRLVLELDGASHKQRASADARKDRVLRRLGYRVLRIEAKLVFQLGASPQRLTAPPLIMTWPLQSLRFRASIPLCLPLTMRS